MLGAKVLEFICSTDFIDLFVLETGLGNLWVSELVDRMLGMHETVDSSPSTHQI